MSRDSPGNQRLSTVPAIKGWTLSSINSFRDMGHRFQQLADDNGRSEPSPIDISYRTHQTLQCQNFTAFRLSRAYPKIPGAAPWPRPHALAWRRTLCNPMSCGRGTVRIPQRTRVVAGLFAACSPLPTGVKGLRTMGSKELRHQPACMVAHDLVNKLSAIVGHCDLLNEITLPGSGTERKVALIRNIAESAAKKTHRASADDRSRVEKSG